MKTKWLHITLLMIVTCLILVGLFGCGCGKTPSGEDRYRVRNRIRSTG